MDTSDLYIKMCWEAEEIQSMHKRFENDKSFSSNEFGNEIFLPRQDQLQLLHDGKNSIELLKEFNHFFFQPPILKIEPNFPPEQMEEFQRNWDKALKENAPIIIQNKSEFEVEKLEFHYFVKDFTFEQMWLAFTMAKLFNKIWDFEKEVWYELTPQNVYSKIVKAD